MGTVKFWQEMDEASNVLGADKMMIGKNDTGEVLYVNFDKAKDYMSVTGAQLAAVTGGAVGSPTSLVAPGTTEMRWMKASPGEYSFGGNTYTAAEGKEWIFEWNGTTWSLKDMGSLPDNSAKAKPWAAGTYEANSIVSHNDIEWIAKVSTSQEPSNTATDWRPVGGGSTEDITYKQVSLGASGDLSTFTTVSTSSFTHGNFTSIPFNGTIDEINCNVQAIGDGTLTFKIIRLVSGNTYEVVHTFLISGIPSVGVKSFKIGEDYDSFYVNKGDILVYDTRSTSARIGYKTVSGKQMISSTTITDTSGTFNVSNNSELGVNIKCSSNILNKKIDDSISDIDALGEKVGSEISIGEKSLSSFTTAASTVSTRAMFNPFPKDGYLTELNAYGFIGQVKVKIFSKNRTGGTYRFEDEFVVELPSSGVHKLVGGVDFPIKKVSKDGLLGFLIGGSQGVGYKTESGVQNYSLGNSDVYGDDISPTITTGVSFGLWYKLGTGIEYELKSIEKVEEPVIGKSTVRNLLKGIGDIFNFRFDQTSLPTNWSESGGWTPTTDGLQSPSVGNWESYVYHNKFFSIDEDDYNVRIVVNDPTSVFSISRLSTTAQGASSTVFEIDGTNGVINLYGGYSIGSAPSVKYSEPLGITMVTGREYNLSISKVSEDYKFIVTDLITLEKQVINWMATGNSVNIGKSINYLSVIFRSGNILVKRALLSSKLPIEPKMMIVGDSIVDGDTIRTVIGGGADKRFVGLISSALDYNCTIFGRGGETSGNITEKLPIIQNIIKGGQYAMYEVGINDTSFSTWYNNMLLFKDMVESKGMTLVLCTLFPRVDREAFCLEVTNYILGSGYKYIDFARAMTVGGNRTTRNNNLFLSDQLHPNPNGHKRMFEQVKVDLPELF